jgi:hypothetical protein
MFSEGFTELIELSQQTKKGLTFYVKGQTIPGYVLRVIDNGGSVEVRNQTFSRIVIRMEQVDAIAIN